MLKISGVADVRESYAALCDCCRKASERNTLSSKLFSITSKLLVRESYAAYAIVAEKQVIEMRCLVSYFSITSKLLDTNQVKYIYAGKQYIRQLDWGMQRWHHPRRDSTSIRHFRSECGLPKFRRRVPGTPVSECFPSREAPS